MAWRWRAEFGSEAPAGSVDQTFVPAPEFTSQSAAEAWLTATYADLAEQGARAVSLYEEDRLVYGPMSLEAD